MKTIAIIGSGIAGLGCAHFLHPRHHLTIFEADDHIGGHSHTISLDEDGHEVVLDTGFMVYNEVTYPLLTRLFAELEVPTKPTSMSFSVHDDSSGLEWSGTNLNTLFAQRRNLWNPRYWRFLLKLNRFNKEAAAALEEEQWAGMTLKQYVNARGYGEDLLNRYLIPMSSAVWSSSPQKMLRFPAMTLLRFWHNHGFLGLHTQHPWRTIDGGSREYVTRLIAPFRNRIFTNTPVNKVRVLPGSGVEIQSHRGAERFDQVIFATHADQALRLLERPSPRQRELLAPFTYQENAVQVHTDSVIMPETALCWASWNHRSEASASSIHYWMNSLQGLSARENYFVSLNAGPLLSEDAACKRALNYEHPLFDQAAVEAQKDLSELNDAQGATLFCGSYFGYGFHEDAFRSAVELSTTLLGSQHPWLKEAAA